MRINIPGSLHVGKNMHEMWQSAIKQDTGQVETMTSSVQNLPINQYTALGHQQTWPVLENGTSSTFFYIF